jgi:tagatose 6-phosphate kinase
MLAVRGVEVDFIEVQARTRQCISVVDEGENSVTELVEESQAVAGLDYESLKAVIQKWLPGSEAVVMSGSLTPGGPADFYRAGVALSNKAGVLSIVDAQGAPLIEALTAKPTLVKPNRQELATTVQRDLGNESEVIQAMQEVRNRGAGAVVVTAGKKAALAMDDTALWRISSPAINAVNPIGSGDAFTAGLVWKLTQSQQLGEACRWAAAAGAANALSAMPGDLEKREVERLLDEVKVERL